MAEAQHKPHSDIELQRSILSHIQRLQRPTVVSTNQVLDAVCKETSECRAAKTELVRLISEAALCLGLIPVFDPKQAVPEKIEAEHRRRRGPLVSDQRPAYVCIHCHTTFSQGGDPSVPICNWCLYRD